ncbi:multidrug efflux SMR transporter [Rhizorhapis sp.]|uniref:DMT family transporter n=1 Tax=Rhizorhapis sp. TaxID=1968842 RepID=UPI002B45909B|nr:multidrug efflux SMR transporter [Rhizorhapis sp.]HKR16937.1 multidrug efflux SMR transporter [Rhizorhapis sp.]
MTNWWYLTFAIIAEVIATSALKSSEGFSRPLPSLVVIAGYGCAFYLLSLALRTIPVALAYAVWSGIGIMVITVIGWFVFRQSLGLVQFTGVGLIMLGTALIRFSS